jgi:hypothetical protein
VDFKYFLSDFIFKSLCAILLGIGFLLNRQNSFEKAENQSQKSESDLFNYCNNVKQVVIYRLYPIKFKGEQQYKVLSDFMTSAHNDKLTMSIRILIYYLFLIFSVLKDLEFS